jgi:hypothetical protein
MRLALTFCALSPLWLAGRLRRFNSLGGAERAALLDRLLHHRIWMIAELTLLLKLCACMALFRSTTLRERSQYDSHEKGGGLPVAHEDSDELSAEVLESGERLRRSLPVVDDAREEEVA